MAEREEDLVLEESPLTFIFRQLLEFGPENKEELQKLEAEIYEILKRNADNTEALIALMSTEILLLHRHKAKALAHKIWEIGGDFSAEIELLFINNLLNIGLIEMASVLLKPKFEKLSETVDLYGTVMLKFSVMTGNYYLLERTAKLLKEADQKGLIVDFVSVYNHLNYADTFKAVQRLVLDFVKENLCEYGYSFYNFRGFSELNITLYTDLLEEAGLKMASELNTKIDFYFLTNKIEKLSNVHFHLEALL